ncbi:hypothetical protein, partial [Klebsiella pneumoniae]
MKLSFQYKLFISLVAFFSVLFIALGIGNAANLL